jgi:hypothetical protein
MGKALLKAGLASTVFQETPRSPTFLRIIAAIMALK